MPFVRRAPASICVVLSLGLCSLLAVGCGGKSGASSSAAGGVVSASSSTAQTGTPPAATSPRQFIVEADAICRKANTRLSKSRVQSKTAEGIATAVVENETIERKALGELARLVPPKELSTPWSKLLRIRRSLAAGLGNLAAAVRRGETKFSALTRSKKQLHGELLKVGGKAGFVDCAKIG